jgi:uncharacterized protein
MRKHLLLILVTLLAAILITNLAVYTRIDNARVTVIRQEVSIPNLPSQFEGFTILQVSDLHSTLFGEGESQLIALINGLPYDLIAFTGDMQDSQGGLPPFLDLVRGIRHSTPMVFVSGNADPEVVDLRAGYIYDVGQSLQSEGLTLLDRPFSIERGGARLWFSEAYGGLTPAEMKKQAQQKLAIEKHPNMAGYFADQIAFLSELQVTFNGITDKDTLIGITHDPLTKAQLDDPHRLSLPLDLVLAGHYHGGQIRLPGIGALVVPSPDEPRGGLFPDQRIVSGLYQGNNIQQYVSRGLGAGGPIPLFKFRLFNPPEINLITLHVKSADAK